MHEIMVWGVLWCLMAIEVAGIGYMICSRPGPVFETDFDVAEADLADLRAESRR